MIKEKSICYKGYPIVRCNNEIYYGNMNDEFIVFIKILSSKNVKGIEVGNKIFVQLLHTDLSLNPEQRIVKQTNKNNLISALEIANVWLIKENSQT